MKPFRQRIYEIIADPPEGDRFAQLVNGSILALIGVNVIVCILQTVGSLDEKYANFFWWFELVSVVIFSLEYVLRLWSCTCRPEFAHPVSGRVKQALTPMTVIDFLAIIPFYLQFVVPGVDLRLVRILRLFRLLRLFRMTSLVRAVGTLNIVFRRKKEELWIAVVVLLVVVLFSATLMYFVEHEVPESKFSSIPAAMWWAIVTVTTIGYGDMVPVTPLGQFLGAIIGFIGVCTFALPVAILGAGFIEEANRSDSQQHTDQPDRPGTGEELVERVAERVIEKMSQSMAHDIAQQVVDTLNNADSNKHP